MSIATQRGTRELLNLKTEEILPNPVQPRRYFDEEGLEELASSIAEHGILQPLTVRRRQGRFELIAGERRLRAAKKLGLGTVPCILIEVTTEQSSLLALVENLQRRDLDFIEEAEGIARLIRVFGISREEISKKLGKSQSAVANKLRILKLPEEILHTLREHKLSERHGRALLRLPDSQSQSEVLSQIIKKSLTVSATEAYIDRLLRENQKSSRQSKFILKDVRVFINTINRGLELMQRGGIGAEIARQETEDELILTINIPRHRA